VIAASTRDISRVFTMHIYHLNYQQDSSKFLSTGGSKLTFEKDYSMDPISEI
jgi:hypothetical protein